MRDFWFKGKMENVPPKPMLSPAERHLMRVSMINPEYDPLVKAVMFHLAELIAATATVFDAAQGDVFAAIQAREPDIAKAILEFAEASDGAITADEATRVLFSLKHSERASAIHESS
jgi:hypothetical protein